jgi:hypothetical protein
MYSLKQAPRAWYQTLDAYLTSVGFVRSRADDCMYVFKSASEHTIVRVYVDDLLIVSKNSSRIAWAKSTLEAKFEMKDLGEVKYILGMQIDHNCKAHTLLLSQPRYLQQVLEHFQMPAHTKAIAMPVNLGMCLSKTGCPTTDEAKQAMKDRPYASLVGSLMYAMVGT